MEGSPDTIEPASVGSEVKRAILAVLISQLLRFPAWAVGDSTINPIGKPDEVAEWSEATRGVSVPSSPLSNSFYVFLSGFFTQPILFAS